MLNDVSIEDLVFPLRQPIAVGSLLKREYFDLGIGPVVQAEGKIETIQSSGPRFAAKQLTVKLRGFPQLFSMTYSVPGKPKVPEDNTYLNNLINSLLRTQVNDESCWLLGAHIPWYNNKDEYEILALRGPFIVTNSVLIYNANGEAIESPIAELWPTIMRYASRLLEAGQIQLNRVDKPGRRA